MHTTQLLSLLLVSAIAFVAANPLVAARETCGCESPTGCPGRCSEKSMCVGYCETNTTVYCHACGSGNKSGNITLACIMNDDGTCFTGKSHDHPLASWH
ncbi:hypothetical protein C8R47DRAFT_1119960 [Mycena vitilis]|nr:hypothetical protein C8R47DRAFT_1119960 [Mycena vitilis]